MDEIEFAIEKFGMDPVEPASEPRYYMGWINDPDAANTPEELAELDRVYNEVDRQSLPDFWDSRAKGTLRHAWPKWPECHNLVSYQMFCGYLTKNFEKMPKSPIF